MSDDHVSSFLPVNFLKPQCLGFPNDLWVQFLIALRAVVS